MYSREMEIVFVLLAALVGASSARGSEQVRKRMANSRFQTVKRESPQPEVDVYADKKQEPVDLHSKEFCVDVSAYKPLQWVEMEGQDCKTELVTRCQEKRENVCAKVMETQCEVIPFTQCSLGMEEQTFSETKLAPKLFVEQTCVQGQRTVPHIKQVPKCRNVTKQNCVTLWEKDAEGNQVWAGKEGCEPVTWQECKLVDKEVQFIVPEITCKPKQELWYHEPQLVNKTEKTHTFTCEVKNTTHCVAKARNDCKYLKWQECREEAVTSCQPKLVHVPTQEKIHRKKCLLPDNEPKPAYGPPPTQKPSYGPPPTLKPAYQHSYSG